MIISRKIIRSLLGLGLLLLAGHAEALSPQQRVVVLGKAPFVGLIDKLNVTPAADFSVARCLTKAWLGKAIVNIRRASDNATKDLTCLVSSGNLDSATFNSFCASTTCFATKVYDQSGNGRDASQATAAKQPQLLLNQIGGRAALTFNGTSQFLSSASPTLSAPITVALVAKRGGGFTTAQVALSFGTGNPLLGYNTSANTALLQVNNGGGAASVTKTASDSTYHQLAGIITASSIALYVDNSSASGAATVSASFTGIEIGGDNGSSFLLNGGAPEVLVFSGDQTSKLTTIYTNQKTEYGTP